MENYYLIRLLDDADRAEELETLCRRVGVLIMEPCQHGPLEKCAPCLLEQLEYERDALQAYCDSENEARADLALAVKVIEAVREYSSQLSSGGQIMTALVKWEARKK